MTGATSTSAGCTVHEMGTDPRAGSRHLSGMRRSFSWRLSPSLMKMATYALVTSSVGAAGVVCGVTVSWAPANAVRFRDQSAAKTGTLYAPAEETPDGSSTHQPRYGAFGSRIPKN